MKHNVLLLFLVFGFAPMAQAEPPAPPRMITVVGEASEEVVPDQAVLSGQLVSRHKQLAVAKQEGEHLLQQVLSVTKQFDIPKDKITASNVSVSPEYQYTNNKQELVGYVVSRSLSITMDKMEVHERLLSKLIDSGITQIGGVTFSVSKQTERMDALRIKAMQNAKTRAQALAAAAGASLGPVVNITMQGSTPPPSPMLVQAGAMRSLMADTGGAPPSLPGLTRIQETISVTFALQ